MYQSSPTAMLTGLTILLFLFWTPTVYSEVLTGTVIIEALNFDSTRYQDFTSQALALPNSPKSPAAQTLVDDYHTYIKAQNIAAAPLPQPPTPFSEAVQYAVEVAAHAINLENRRSLAAFAAKKNSFTPAQKKSLYQDISAQLTIIAQFLNVTSILTPQVQPILEADYGVIRKTVVDTAAVFAGSY